MRAGLLLLLLVGGCFRSEPLRCRVDQDCAPFGVCDPLTRTCALPGPDASVGDLAVPSASGALCAHIALERDVGAVVRTAVWIEDPMLRYRRPIEPIRRRSKHVLPLPAAG